MSEYDNEMVVIKKMKEYIIAAGIIALAYAPELAHRPFIF
jgi:hypothetical protein